MFKRNFEDHLLSKFVFESEKVQCRSFSNVVALLLALELLLLARTLAVCCSFCLCVVFRPRSKSTVFDFYPARDVLCTQTQAHACPKRDTYALLWSVVCVSCTAYTP